MKNIENLIKKDKCKSCKKKNEYEIYPISCKRCNPRIIKPKKIYMISYKTDHKYCNFCNMEKHIDEFNKSNKCKECHRKWKREYYKKPDVKKKERQYFLQSYFKRKYGITLEQYNEMLTKQNGVCAICKQPESYINHKNKMPESLSVDHCHKTGKIRGLLCKTCNQVLGSFKDDISRFE